MLHFRFRLVKIKMWLFSIQVDRHREFSNGPLGGSVDPELRALPWGLSKKGEGVRPCLSHIDLSWVHRSRALRSGKLVHPDGLRPLLKGDQKGDFLSSSNFEVRVHWSVTPVRKTDHCLSTGFDLNQCQRFASYLFCSLSSHQSFLFVWGCSVF